MGRLSFLGEVSGIVWGRLTIPPWGVIQVYYPTGQHHTAPWWSHPETGGGILSLRPPIWSYNHPPCCCNGLSVDSGRLLSRSGWWVTTCYAISRPYWPEWIGLILNFSLFLQMRDRWSKKKKHKPILVVLDRYSPYMGEHCTPISSS